MISNFYTTNIDTLNKLTREVPRNNETADANGLVAGVRKFGFAGLDRDVQRKNLRH